MQSSVPLSFLLMILEGMLALASIVIAFRFRPTRQSRPALMTAVLSPLVMVALFYSLAIHVYYYLGGWPAGMGDKGFSPALIVHETVFDIYFVTLVLATIYLWPFAYILCAVVRRWRAGLYYLGVYAFSFLLCFGATLLAPSAFWDWWLD